MARDNKVSMPSSMGGLTRYFDEYQSKISIKPGHVIFLIIAVMAIVLLLHMYGYGWLGMT
jgi:preprotein translocase subunit Sec61beta